MSGEVENGGTLVDFIRDTLADLKVAVSEIRGDVKKLLPLEHRVEELENWRWHEVKPALDLAQNERAKTRGVREDAQHDGNIIQIRYFKYGVFGLAASVLIALASLLVALHTARIIF